MDQEEDLIRSFPSQELAQGFLTSLSQFLSTQEAIDIFGQFQSQHWIRNGQVLWSGIPRDRAQKWADHHHLQTLTTAMGPLMDTNNPACLKRQKKKPQWSRYVHGASAVFAWQITQGEKVTLLSPPPPERFHPSGLTYYQIVEEPIIKGLVKGCAVNRIVVAHPTARRGQDVSYELWPNDKATEWTHQFGSNSLKTKWRETGRDMNKNRFEMLMTGSGRDDQLDTNKVRPSHSLLSRVNFCSW